MHIIIMYSVFKGAPNSNCIVLALCFQKVWRPLFEPDVFRNQMYYIEEITCDIVGSFRRPP